jgi:ketosteroid isomerase-like protein
LLTAAFVALAGIVVGASQPDVLTTLAQAERDFAARARDIGWRDAFLEFFAEDAIMFANGPVRAKEGLLAGKPVPFAEEQLTWEPRLGDVAASGELGWLTGPAALVVPASKTPGPHHQNYLSVWERQPGRPWRVVIDVGVPTPDAPPFDPDFTRFAMPDRSSGRTAGARDLASADRDLNERLARAGVPAGYDPVLTGATRFHRPRAMPLVGRSAILAGATRPGTFSGTTLFSRSAQSDDLGYAYGAYTVSGTTDGPGTYLRIWQRRADGTWVLAVDLMRPNPAK